MKPSPVRFTRPARAPRQSRTSSRLDIHIPIRALITLTLWFAGLWFFTTLSSLILQLVIGFMLASAFTPLVIWLGKRGISRGGAVALIGAGLLLGIGLFLLVLIPAIAKHAGRFSENLPGYAEQLGDRLQRLSPDLYEQFQGNASQGETNIDQLLSSLVVIGSGLVQSVVITFSIAAFTVYLLLDGKRIYEWLTGELPEPNRTRARSVIVAAGQVVSSYVRGQAVASFLFGAFVFVVLSIIGVPEPFLLAILAAFLDAVPIIGPVIATVPAVLLALTVSPEAAILVLVLYLVYQQIENYIIFPRVFRSTLQLHPLAVLVAVLVGTQLLGIIGALLALPVSAIIPVAVRIWRATPPRDKGNEPRTAGGSTYRRPSVYTMRTRRS